MPNLLFTWRSCEPESITNPETFNPAFKIDPKETETHMFPLFRKESVMLTEHLPEALYTLLDGTELEKSSTMHLYCNP